MSAWRFSFLVHAVYPSCTDRLLRASRDLRIRLVRVNDQMASTVDESVRRGQGIRAVLDLVATLTMIAAAGALIWSATRNSAQSPQRAAMPVPSEPQSLEGAPRMGNADARVVIIEFSDFECPYCGKFAREILPTLKTKYIDPGRVQLVFRHYPLPRHLRAERAAQGAECAAKQGRFWTMHDSLFGVGARLEEGDLAVHAKAAGLMDAQFQTCMALET